MLDLAGRKADGWLPSRFFLEPEDAFAGLERVRRAAEGAGRDPAAIEYAVDVWVRIEEGAEPRRGQVAGGPSEVAGELAAYLRGASRSSTWPSPGTPPSSSPASPGRCCPRSGRRSAERGPGSPPQWSGSACQGSWGTGNSRPHPAASRWAST